MSVTHLVGTKSMGQRRALILSRTSCAAFLLSMLAMAPVPVQATTTNGRSCASVSSLTLPNATVDGATVNATGTATVPSFGGTVTLSGLPAFCDVTLTVTNPPAADRIQ